MQRRRYPGLSVVESLRINKPFPWEPCSEIRHLLHASRLDSDFNLECLYVKAPISAVASIDKACYHLAEVVP